MRSTLVFWLVSAGVLLGAAALGGCGGDDGSLFGASDPDAAAGSGGSSSGGGAGTGGTAAGSGGSTATGGAGGQGGSVSTGGAGGAGGSGANSGSGGTPGNGGTGGTPGKGGSGGTPGTGGTGGTSGTGGTAGTGGTPGTGGAGGTGGTPGTGGTAGTGGSVCTDAYEPNNSEWGAVNLGTITDCDSTGGTIQGNLDGSQDADWFQYVGTDEDYCVVDPLISTLNNVQVCIFGACTGGTVLCLQGVSTVSPQGMQGCCSTNAGGNARLQMICNGVPANIAMSVTQPLEQCTAYSFSYHY